MGKKSFSLVYIANIFLIFYVWSMTSWLDFTSSELWLSVLALARLSGLLLMFSILVQFLLIGRMPIIEKAFGLDRLSRIHRLNGFLSFGLLFAHVFGVVTAYRLESGLSIPEQYQEIFSVFPYTLSAFIAYVVMITTVGLSIALIRKRLKYEWWYYIHLLNYLVVSLSFLHQVVNGTELVAHDWFRYYWYGLFIFTIGQFIIFRMVRPFVLYRRHMFTVDRVEKEANKVISIYIKGKNLDKFDYKAGQFAKWWFPVKGFFWEEHPFTISVEPNGEYLRLTPKELGDYTARLNKLKPGSPVVVDGPYGLFTPMAARGNKKLLFIAGGIGITPLRAMIAAQSTKDKDMILLYSARTLKDLTFKDELEKLARERKLSITYILANEEVKGTQSGRIDKSILERLVTDIKQRDIFICGPPQMMNAIEKISVGLGVPACSIHTEKFSL